MPLPSWAHLQFLTSHLLTDDSVTPRIYTAGAVSSATNVELLKTSQEPQAAEVPKTDSTLRILFPRSHGVGSTNEGISALQMRKEPQAPKRDRLKLQPLHDPPLALLSLIARIPTRVLSNPFGHDDACCIHGCKFTIYVWVHGTTLYEYKDSWPISSSNGTLSLLNIIKDCKCRWNKTTKGFQIRLINAVTHTVSRFPRPRKNWKGNEATLPAHLCAKHELCSLNTHPTPAKATQLARSKSHCFTQLSAS